MRQPLSRDTRLLVTGQAVRGLGYGFTAVVLGDQLAARGVGALEAGVLLASLIAGSALMSLVVGAFADRFGRRRSYGLFFLGVAVAGVILASDPPTWLFFVVALTGTLSTDVVDNGPATTLEQVMLATEDGGTGRVYGWYNAAGAAFGALGALGAASVHLGSSVRGTHAMLFGALVPVGLVGALAAWGLSRAVEVPRLANARVGRTRLGPSRHVVHRLSALFAVDAAGGGLATASFLSYYFVSRYGVSLTALGWLFFGVSITQALSVLVAPLLARRFGLVETMVGTHLPSNVLLAAMAFAPSFRLAAVLLIAKTTLSQMDVPTRQALVMSVITPPERSQAAAVTNAARYSVRPVAPLIGGALQSLGLGVPLLVAGVVKGGYDLALWRWARQLGLRSREMSARSPQRAKPEENS